MYAEPGFPANILDPTALRFLLDGLVDHFKKVRGESVVCDQRCTPFKDQALTTLERVFPRPATVLSASEFLAGPKWPTDHLVLDKLRI
jgi:hypothetical protein